MKNTLGIVRETKNEWERRVPLTPQDLGKLITELNIDVKIQSSDLRIFSEKKYQSIGAKIDEDISDRDVIIGIKEIKTSDLMSGKVYLYFSHTIKGQAYNMEMLQRLLDLGCTLIDYERMVNEKNQRVIFFSYHAGVAGIIDTFWSYGQRLNWEGIDSPFNMIKQSYHYADQTEAEEDFKRLAEQIKTNGLPEEIIPLVIGITGYGNVARGVQDMLKHLPISEVEPAEVQKIGENHHDHRHTVYTTVFKEEDMVKPLSDNDSFNLQDYYDHPEKYQTDFEKYLPHLSILVNASYWDVPYPRHVTNNSLKKLYSGVEKPSLRVIGDISCDIEGGIECTLKATDPGNPVFVYDPEKNEIFDGIEGNGPVIMSVDNLPSELPKDASIYFSLVLREYISPLLSADFNQDFTDLQLPDTLKKAVITHKGRLTPDYEYLNEYL